ncbi:hypothetical protein CALVIDRAFT_598337 [Calocera viscosa TUFC12733]|uniref:Uncharacterized protein n=1 Tax=Calocera viscosa (strain TUFC12733) TaxID=1330018 RepID=A0A167M6C7_CALVF|nr:hypothetical protein CALVIDRAFT_598337 [Calocera viscosa TUFC12733]
MPDYESDLKKVEERDALQVEATGNNSAFTIQFKNLTVAETFNRKELVIQQHVTIQTSQEPGKVLAPASSQTLSYGYSSWTFAGHAESTCSVSWVLNDNPWWFGVAIHVPSKGLGIGTWPYYLISSQNADGHNGGWWNPVQHASQPWEIVPDEVANVGKWKIKITPVSTGSTLSVAVSIVDLPKAEN